MVAIAVPPSDSASTNSPSEPPAPAQIPESPRDFFNAGARQLQAGKLREAEAFFETALARQDPALQPPALYNLGHVRFAQGLAELKKGPAAGPTAARGRSALAQADSAVRTAEDALAVNEVRQMVAAYVRGRGARKELSAATKAVKQAVEVHGAVLGRWQRAAGDFRSALELNPQDRDALHNAEVVERSIAKLVDSLRELQALAQAMGQKKQELGEKMKELKGRIPEPDMPPGAPGDEEEEEEQPKGPEPGMEEGRTREGEEQALSPEQASWLLEAFKLGGDRRLPMGQDSTADPKKRARSTW